MPSKTEEYLALAQRTANGLTRYWESWTDYLTTASRLYKYPFADQLMIYAQRPDATACADYDIWNNRMNRYVRRGSKGIALLDESSGFPRLHYVFDVSDTGVRRNSRDPDLWQYNDDLKQPVSEMLAATYGISGERVSQQLADVAGKLVADYWDNNSEDISAIVDGSLLMDYDEAGVEMQFKSAAAISVTYTLLERCGFEPDGYFDKDSFQAIYDFSTPDTVYTLGAAVSDISREVLRTVERAVKTTIRRRNNERSQHKYEQQSELYADRGLSSPEPDPASAEEPAGQVRQDAPELSETAAPGSVPHDAPEREPVPDPDRTGADRSSDEEATDGRSAGEEPGPGQGEESDGVGTAHEQPTGAGRGSDSDGTDLQLSFLDAVIPTEAQQIEHIDRAESEKSPSAFVLSQAEIENELRKHGSGFQDGKQRIIELYQTQPDRKLRAKALAKEYGIGGHSQDFLDGSSGFVNHDGKGLEFDHYPDHQKVTLSWTQVEKYIDLMIQSDRYLTDKEKEHRAAVQEAERQLPMLDGDAAAEYNALKEQYPNTLIGFELGGYFLFYDKDAITVKEVFRSNLLSQENALGKVKVTGFLRREWVAKSQKLWAEGNSIYLAGQGGDGTHHQTKYLREEDYLPIGIIIKLDGRDFRVDHVNFMFKSVSLQDMDLTNSGQPIFRVERLPNIRELYEQQQDEIIDVSPEKAVDYKVGDEVVVDLPTRTIEGKIGYVGETDVRIDTSAHGQSWDNEVLNKQQFEDGLRRDEPTPDEELDKLPISVEVNGEWQTFPDAAAADEALNAEPMPEAAGNFHITDDNLGVGGPKQKFARNIEAIQTLRTLEQEHRGATAEEQQVLSQYVGWGGLADVFDPNKENWSAEYTQLKGLLTEEEYAAARASTLNAHYTSPVVIRAIYDAVEKMGFQSGNILEPSMGIGNFFGMLPSGMADSRLYGVELDSITGRIAQKLYPQADITVAGFETTDRRDFYDLAVGNVPFGQYKVNDKAYNKLGFSIHNYFFAKTIVNDLIDQQLNDYPDEDIKATQERLNAAYDAFTAKYGLLNDRKNGRLFEQDSSYYLLCSLENLDEQGQLKSKAAMFTKRTIRPERTVTSVDTPSEALAVSIGEHGKVDLPYMAELLGTPGEYGRITTELSGVIFKDPAADADDPEAGWQTADEYLSGNVRDKLRMAQLAAESRSEFKVNVDALTKAQPKDLEASEIDVRLGATWLAPSIVQQFMMETFQPPYRIRYNNSITVRYSPYTSEWRISNKSATGFGDIMATETYGTRRANAYKILEDTLNLRDSRVYDTIVENGKEKRVLNQNETTLAQQKQQAIKDAFAGWVWKDPQRRALLVKKYNELFNSTRPREYDGSHIHFVGMNPEINLREHQRNAVAHVLYGYNTLLAHEVGAGKSFEMAASAMELKRLGLCQKSLFVVPNHLTEQWASEFLRLYPNAKLLVTSKKDFEPANRKKFCARIATGDYDAVIIGHSQFEKIPLSAERQERLIQEQMDEIEEAIEEAKAQVGEHFTVKQLEKLRKSLKQKLKKLQGADRKDDVVTFEQLGVDRLFVDESQAFKNLYLYTKMRNVAGLSTSEAQKSSDMFGKCRYLDEITGGRGVIFATGTPLSNSMTEMYTLMRYLQYNTLQQKGLTHFDAWASTFGETTTAIELAPEGTGYRARTRFAKFFNLPELMAMFKEAADIKTSDQLNLPVPQAKFETVVVKPSEIQQDMVQALSERAAEVHSGSVDPSVDNMLKITSDGRKIGLDQRLMNSALPDDPNSKLNACVNNVLRIWNDTKEQKLTQLIFCDMSTPKGDGSFNVYDDIRTKLLNAGVPEQEIEFIHNADTENKKAELFSKVRSGQVRVLLGSTAKMGAGTNVQTLLVAVHHLDVGWRPSDMTQRNGRIIRQGNQNKQVYVYNYVTESTFDAYLYQTLENKQKFISQIMTSKSPMRSCDDIDEQALSYAEIKALCAGDPRIREKMDLDVQVAKLKVLRGDFQNQKYRLEDKLLKTFPEEIQKQKTRIAALQQDSQIAAAHPQDKENFCGMTIKGMVYDDKKAAGERLLLARQEMPNADMMLLGTYRGFELNIRFDSFKNEHQAVLRAELSYPVSLGDDARGNITRLDNAIDNFTDRIADAENALQNLEQQKQAAEVEVAKPFAQEEELAEKSARLAELNALLNIDRDRSSSQDAPEEAEETEAPATRPSVLSALEEKANQPEPVKPFKSYLDKEGR